MGKNWGGHFNPILGGSVPNSFPGAKKLGILAGQIPFIPVKKLFQEREFQGNSGPPGDFPAPPELTKFTKFPVFSQGPPGSGGVPPSFGGLKNSGPRVLWPESK